MQCTEFSEVECGKGCGCVINLRALYLTPFSCSMSFAGCIQIQVRFCNPFFINS